MRLINYTQFNLIKFPVYILPSSNIELADGLLFVDNELVDDKNMPGETLGIRRVQTPHKNLLKLNKQIENPTGMIKQPPSTFIDSAGIPFLYEKTLMCRLEYKKIRRVDRKGTGSLLWLHGINFPIQIIRPPEDGYTWAGILHYHGLPWMLYEFSQDKKPSTRRKV